MIWLKHERRRKLMRLQVLMLTFFHRMATQLIPKPSTFECFTSCSCCVLPGTSLLLVFLYGVLFIYLYSLIAFAFFRDIHPSNTGLYCETVYQCFVTYLHRGLIIGTYEVHASLISAQPLVLPRTKLLARNNAAPILTTGLDLTCRRLPLQLFFSLNAFVSLWIAS